MAATAPDIVVLVVYEEAPRLVADLVTAGYPVDHIVGLDGMLAADGSPSRPSRATRTGPTGSPCIGTTGDRALINRLRQTTAARTRSPTGRRCTTASSRSPWRRSPPGRSRRRRSPPRSGRSRRAGGRCSTFAHCVELLAAGEDIDYDGTTGHLGIDAAGDVSTARITTARVIDGQLQPVARQDIDLEAQRQDAVFASAVFVAQLQQALKVLGFYDGDVTGIYDDATTAAVGALQSDLGLPATGAVRRRHRRRPARAARWRGSARSAPASWSCSRRSTDRGLLHGSDRRALLRRHDRRHQGVPDRPRRAGDRDHRRRHDAGDLRPRRGDRRAARAATDDDDPAAEATGADRRHPRHRRRRRPRRPPPTTGADAEPTRAAEHRRRRPRCPNSTSTRRCRATASSPP